MSQDDPGPAVPPAPEPPHLPTGAPPDPLPDPAAGATALGLRLLVVPGVNPAKWLRVWAERLPDEPVTLVHADPHDAVRCLRAGDADAALVRLPVDRAHLGADLSAIPLYTETTVVVTPADHVLTAADELTPADLADEVLLVPDDDVVPWPDRPGEASALPAPVTTAQAMELVAAGVGVLVVPQSLARLHHRRDLTYRPVVDAPTSTVALAWVTDDAPELVEELIGIVRGRTVNSSRGRAGSAARTGAPSSDEPRSGRAAGGAGRAAGAARSAGGRPRGGKDARGGSGGRGRSGGGGKGGGGRGGSGRGRGGRPG